MTDKSSTNTVSAGHLTTVNNLDPVQSNEIIFTNSCIPAYAEIPKRYASFATWPNENLPFVDDLVRAGFFYTGTKTIVTCFYCNGSLRNWDLNDNPMVEHARWFPRCAYAKQLCGDELYRKIQESKRVQQERSKVNEQNEKITSGITSNTSTTTNTRQLLTLDGRLLSRLVAARLDLPISQRLLDQNFKLSTIKRCLEDQLRLKQDNFVSECDLHTACLILQKQIDHIEGRKENNVITSRKIRQIRKQNEACLSEQTTNTTQASLNPTDIEMAIPSQSLTNESTSFQLSSHRADTKNLLTRNFLHKIQKYKQAQQDRTRTNELIEKASSGIVTNTDITTNSEQIFIKEKDFISKQEQEVIIFPEEKEKTIQRERLICGWPLLSPSPINMFSAGRSHNSTKGKYYTICIDCRLEYHNWQPEDNPLTIHQQLSPSCPFLLATYRMHPTLVPIKSLGELLTQDKIASEAAQPVSNVILISDSSYAEPPKRAESYSTFHGGPPENVEALVLSGFYYRSMSTLVQCYNCGGAANDLHQYSSKEINSEHRKRFPHCRLAQSLPQQDEVRSIDHANLCKWCLVNPNELVIYPCMHLAICHTCTQLMRTCPNCGIEAEAFFKLFK